MFENKLSEKEMNGDETQLTWELQDLVLVLNVSCVSMYLHT